jgi:hypothetical protein
MATHVGFGRGPFEDPAIGVDEGQLLALELRKAGPRRWAFVKCLTHSRFIRASMLKEVQMNIKFRVDLSQSERDQLDALLSGGRHATRKIKRAQILVAANDGLSDQAIAATLRTAKALGLAIKCSRTPNRCSASKVAWHFSDIPTYQQNV